MKPEQLLKLHRAMRLEYYPEPPKLDPKAVFEGATDKTRFGQPTVLAHTVGDSGYVRLWITPTSAKELDIYATELFARIAARNALAENFAARLAKADAAIAVAAKAMAEVDTKAVGDAPKAPDLTMHDPKPDDAEPLEKASARLFGNVEMLASSEPGNSYAEAFEELHKERTEAAKPSFAERMKAAKAAKAKGKNKDAAK